MAASGTMIDEFSALKARGLCGYVYKRSGVQIAKMPVNYLRLRENPLRQA